ncbi:MAG: aminotransferase class I/II-fold pyridoxal phosphate-dependent enzyme [Rhodothermales bacterium]
MNKAALNASTLIDLLRWRATHQADRVAYTFLKDGEEESEQLTYAELDTKARAIAAHLLAQEGTGERALLLYPASLEYIAAFFGCLYAGVIAVPVYPPRKNRSMERVTGIVSDAKAKFTLTTRQISSDIERRFAEHPELAKLPIISTDELPLDGASVWAEPNVTSESIAFLQYTSGSTGSPKGVMVSHGNLLHNERQIQNAFGMDENSSVLGWLPLYHDMGLIGNVLNPLYVGYPCYLMAPVAFLQKPIRWLQAISKYGARISGGPNFAYDLCVRKITDEQIAELDLSSWKVAFNGAEPVHPETLERFTKKFAPAGFSMEDFSPCYGLAEATLFVASNKNNSKINVKHVNATALQQNEIVDAAHDDEDVRALVSSGVAWENQTIKIVDPEALTACKDGKVGEIWVSGESIAKGYWGKEEVTARTFSASIAKRNGQAFLRTGDLGFLSEGQLYVTGRLKDLIIIRGRNHYPQDIEVTIETSHEALEQGACAAFSFDLDGAERLGIAIEIRRVNMRNLDADEVVKAIRKAVSEKHELQVHSVILLKPKSIPKTSSGKIQRHACKVGYLTDTLNVVNSNTLAFVDAEDSDATEAFLDRGALSSLPVSERKTLVSFFLQQLVGKALKMNVSDVDPNQSLSTLGMDSLDTIELKLEIERNLKVTVPMDEALNDMSVVELADKLSYQFSSNGNDYKEAPKTEVIIKDLFEKCDEEGGYFGKYRLNKDDYFTQPKLEGTPGPRMKFQGRDVIVWSINNYLGLIGEEKIHKTAIDSVTQHGLWTPMGSRMLTGNTERHLELERRLASYLHKEASIVFNFGYMGVMGTIDAVTDGNDTIIIDSLSHACIVDGALIASAGKQFRVFRHNDMDSLEKQLKAANENRKGGVLIITEGVFGMTGDIGKLDEICVLKEKYDARLFVDDAHGFGVMGPTGAGVGEFLGVQDKVDLYFGTFAKSFAGIGGVTAGDDRVIDYIKYNARTNIFAKSLPMPYVETMLTTLDFIENGDEYRNRMWHVARRLQEGLSALGFNIGDTQSPITPVYVPAGDEETATRAIRLLRTEYGIFVSAVTYPVVPRGVVLFRLTSSSSHTDEDIDITLEAFKKLRDQLNLSSEEQNTPVTGDLVEPTQ